MCPPAQLTQVLPAMEQALADHPGVIDSRVLSVPGQDVVAVVVPSELSCPLEIREDLRVLAEHSGWAVEPAVLAVAELHERDRPLDAAYVHAELAGSPSASRYEPPVTELETALADDLARMLGRARVGVHDDFVDLGGDSLTAVAFIASVLQRHDVELSVVELFGAGTVRRMAELLAGR